MAVNKRWHRGSPGPGTEPTLEYEKHVDTNVMGTLRACAGAARVLPRRQCQHRHSVVHLRPGRWRARPFTSRQARGRGSYTKAAALAVAGWALRGQSSCHSPHRTGMLNGSTAMRTQAAWLLVCRQRVGLLKRLTPAMCWSLRQGSLITGASIDVDGGQTAG